MALLSARPETPPDARPTTVFIAEAGWGAATHLDDEDVRGVHDDHRATAQRRGIHRARSEGWGGDDGRTLTAGCSDDDPTHVTSMYRPSEVARLAV